MGACGNVTCGLIDRAGRAQYDEAVVAAEEGEDDMEADPDKQFLKYLSDAYMAFLSANDDRFNMLNEALARDIGEAA